MFEQLFGSAQSTPYDEDEIDYGNDVEMLKTALAANGGALTITHSEAAGGEAMVVPLLYNNTLYAISGNKVISRPIGASGFSGALVSEVWDGPTQFQRINGAYNQKKRYAIAWSSRGTAVTKIDYVNKKVQAYPGIPEGFTNCGGGVVSGRIYCAGGIIHQQRTNLNKIFHRDVNDFTSDWEVITVSNNLPHGYQNPHLIVHEGKWYFVPSAKNDGSNNYGEGLIQNTYVEYVRATNSFRTVTLPTNFGGANKGDTFGYFNDGIFWASPDKVIDLANEVISEAPYSFSGANAASTYIKHFLLHPEILIESGGYSGRKDVTLRLKSAA